jgi:hypothetical protein
MGGKRVIVLILLFAGIGAVLYIYGSGSKYFDFFGNSSSGDDSGHAGLDNLERAEYFIAQNKLDSATGYLNRVMALRIDSTVDTVQVDTARSLLRQIRQIEYLDSGTVYIGVLLAMQDREYENLLDHKMNQKILNHPQLNRIYLDKLYRKSRHNGRSGNGRSGDEPGPDSVQVISRRHQFAETIRNSFSTLGFEISVEITGADHSGLTLTAPEFDDTWFEKFESDSAMEEWHKMGFTRVEIKNNSGYAKVRTW